MSDDTTFRQIGETRPGGIVCLADHAGNTVPADIALGIAPELMTAHIAWDIGIAGLCERLARRHGIAAHLATVSRLVVDLHRETHSAGLIPETSDGYLVPGNIGADKAMRIARFYDPYHAALGQWLDAADPALILSIHSFTPGLASKPEEQRPWEVGLLYNEDDRAARHAIRFFGEQGFTVGDNQPYSGKQLNATMNRHAEAHGRPYCAIEIRQDLLASEADQARWAKVIAQMAGYVAGELKVR